MQQAQRIKVEENLCSKFDRKHSFIVGSGTLAILIALKSLEINKGEVIIPTFTCPNVFYAVMLSGLTPVFCDINKDDFTIDISSLKNSLSPETKVILPVHKFGYPANLDEIEEICTNNKLRLVEDAAQAMGGRYRNRMLGSFGDISIFSFGYSKIIDVGCGGAILTNNQGIAKNISMLKNHLTSNNIIASIKNHMSKKIFLEWNLKKTFALKLLKLIPCLLKYNISESHLERITEKLGELDETVERRKINASSYKKRLQHRDIFHPKYYSNDGAIWRYSILTKDNITRNRIIKRVTEEGIFVSCLYPSLHKIFLTNKYRKSQETYKNSEEVNNRIINLQVNAVHENRLEKTSEIILDSLNRDRITNN